VFINKCDLKSCIYKIDTLALDITTEIRITNVYLKKLID